MLSRSDCERKLEKKIGGGAGGGGSGREARGDSPELSIYPPHLISTPMDRFNLLYLSIFLKYMCSRWYSGSLPYNSKNYFPSFIFVFDIFSYINDK